MLVHKGARYSDNQQLFDLVNDPQECADLAGEGKHRELLAFWRRRMVAHLAERGEPYVVKGDLGIRRRPMLYR